MRSLPMTKRNSIDEQYACVLDSVRYLCDMIRGRLGNVVNSWQRATGRLHSASFVSGGSLSGPLDYAVGDTQGAIGYMFQKAFKNELQRRGIHKPIVSLVTQTLVDKDDAAFSHPSKPIGAFLDRHTAMQRQKSWAGQSWRTQGAAGDVPFHHLSHWKLLSLKPLLSYCVTVVL